jgi:transposase-like protein
MPEADRSRARHAASGIEVRYSFTEFVRGCPDDVACLDMLWRERYARDGHTADCPKCGRQRRFHRIKSRPAYSCDTCGHSLYPLAGTIFNKSSTSLHLWFYAIYILSSTRCEVSAKQLERELGVTYKTAWRMFNLICAELADDGELCALRAKIHPGGVAADDQVAARARRRRHLRPVSGYRTAPSRPPAISGG